MFNITYDIISDSPKIINIFYEKISVSCLEDVLTSRAIRALLNVLVTTRHVKQLSIGPFITELSIRQLFSAIVNFEFTGWV